MPLPLRLVARGGGLPSLDFLLMEEGTSCNAPAEELGLRLKLVVEISADISIGGMLLSDSENALHAKLPVGPVKLLRSPNVVASTSSRHRCKTSKPENSFSRLFSKYSVEDRSSNASLRASSSCLSFSTI
jgi:hypothetical protein